jgi:hypothetical protein
MGNTANPDVDRCASAGRVKRFIDKNAGFFFIVKEGKIFKGTNFHVARGRDQSDRRRVFHKGSEKSHRQMLRPWQRLDIMGAFSATLEDAVHVEALART